MTPLFNELSLITKLHLGISNKYDYVNSIKVGLDTCVKCIYFSKLVNLNLISQTFRKRNMNYITCL